MTETLYANPIRQYLSQFIIDDDDLLEHVLTACFSSFTGDPINLGVMAPTSQGKSYVISLVTGLFPNAYTLTGSSAKSFFYDEGRLIDRDTGEDCQARLDKLKDELDQVERNSAEARSIRAEIRAIQKRAVTKVELGGRILVFLEPPDQGLFEALKPILSHDKYESYYQTVEKSSAGEIRTRKILLSGWPVFIFASAKDQDTWSVWPELQSRCVIVSPNMSSEKYLRANALTAQLKGLPSFALRKLFPKDLEVAAKEEVKQIQHDIELFRLLGKDEYHGNVTDNSVFNPLAEQLLNLFPHEDGIRMRQFRYFLQYVNLSALINCAKRPRLVIQDQARAVIATYDDIATAARLVLSGIWTRLPRYKVDFWEKVLVPLYEKSARKIAGTNEVMHDLLPVSKILEQAKEQGLKYGPRQLRESILNALEEAGLAQSVEDPSDRRQKLWKPLEDEARKYAKLGDSRIFDPQKVKESLKKLQIQLGDLVPYYAYADGRLVSDLSEFLEVILPQQRSDEVEEFVSSEQKEVEARETLPGAKIKVYTCSVCGKQIGYSPSEPKYVNARKEPLCRDHFLESRKDDREVDGR